MSLKSKKIILTLGLIGCFAYGAAAQIAVPDSPKSVNFGYSKNPKTKSKTQNAEANVGQTTTASSAAVVAPQPSSAQIAANDSDDSPQNGISENRSIAKKTFEIAKRADTVAASPTEIYKVGVGDVLFISLQSAPAKASTYFTVLNDGTIDYPLAGEMIPVAGLTAEEIEDVLKEKVKLYENPQISVKVRETTSHSVSVLGLVEKAGEKFIQREAVPLYVVKAEAVVEARANQLFIKRANTQTETVDLRDQKSEEILIFPGDILEFKSTEGISVSNAPTPLFYYIGGEIKSAGQKDFHSGLTLTQAILACGGLRKPNVRRVVVRRKNEQGLLSPIEFDLNAVRDGKQPDPILQAGDTIEIVK